MLILRDVLDFPAREVAAMSGATQESVTSALKRARATTSSTSGSPYQPVSSVQICHGLGDPTVITSPAASQLRRVGPVRQD